MKDWLKNGKPGAPYAGALGADTKFTGEMVSVGQGSVDWKRIFAASEAAGIKHYIVEYDNPKSPLDDLSASYQYLRNLSF